MKSVDIRTASYFPGAFVFIGIIMALWVPVVAVMQIYWLMVLLLGISALLITSHHRISIDPKKKEVFDYVWILWNKTGEKVSYNKIDYIFIKENKRRQTLHSRVSSTSVSDSVYDAYLRLNNDRKIHLYQRKSKNKLIDKISPIADDLNIEWFDYT